MYAFYYSVDVFFLYFVGLVLLVVLLYLSPGVDIITTVTVSLLAVLVTNYWNFALVSAKIAAVHVIGAAASMVEASSIFQVPALVGLTWAVIYVALAILLFGKKKVFKRDLPKFHLMPQLF